MPVADKIGEELGLTLVWFSLWLVADEILQCRHSTRARSHSFTLFNRPALEGLLCLIYLQPPFLQLSADTGILQVQNRSPKLQELDEPSSHQIVSVRPSNKGPVRRAVSESRQLSQAA